MNNQLKVFSRREMLEMSPGISGLTALGGSAFAQEAYEKCVNELLPNLGTHSIFFLNSNIPLINCNDCLNFTL